MNLSELKQKATASELTLIERVETLVKDEVVGDVLDRCARYLEKNPPPTREEIRFGNPDLGRQWFALMRKEMALRD